MARGDAVNATIPPPPTATAAYVARVDLHQLARTSLPRVTCAVCETASVTTRAYLDDGRRGAARHCGCAPHGAVMPS